MSKLYKRYIVYNYLKNFAIVFTALEFFYVSIDLLSNFKELPKSANLQLLYVYYSTQSAVNFTLPLSIIFAMLITKFSLIRTNELIVLYASGVSKKAIVRLFFLSSLLISFGYIALGFTQFAYSYEYARNIIKNATIASNTVRLFVKRDNNYIYVERLNQLKKHAVKIKIFEIKNKKLIKAIEAKEGYFQNGAWTFIDAVIRTFPKEYKLGEKGYKIEHKKTHIGLVDFRPKIIENIHRGRYNMSVPDAYDALLFLKKQGNNQDRAKTLIYSQILFPLFAPLLIVIIFYKLPVSSRFFDLAITSFVYIFASLCTWALFFALNKLSSTSTILPEVGVILPMVLLMGVSFYFYKNHK